MPRGRPRHPDILTPREWEVLALIREGLTNGQIADRLGISENGAKYHVLEILSKLGVASRYEAAAWEREPAPAGRRFAGLAVLPAWRPPRLGSLTASKVATAGLAATVAGAVGLLAGGVLIMDQRAASFGALPEITTSPAPSAAPATATETAAPSSTPVTPATTASPTSTPGALTATATPPGTPTLAPGAIPPPPGTAGPGFTPPPTATLPPNVLTELPVSASEAMAAFATSVGTRYAGECSPATQAGELCYNLREGTPSLEAGNRILVRLRITGELLAYELVLSPDATGSYGLESSSGPNTFTIQPPQ